jgi:hypothetical protein
MVTGLAVVVKRPDGQSPARRAELCLAPNGPPAQLEGEVQSMRWADVGVLIEDEREVL